jgi:hypothetical protein
MDGFLYNADLVHNNRFRSVPVVALKLNFRKAFDYVN